MCEVMEKYNKIAVDEALKVEHIKKMISKEDIINCTMENCWDSFGELLG